MSKEQVFDQKVNDEIRSSVGRNWSCCRNWNV